MTTVTINLELLEKIGKLNAEKQRQVLAYVNVLLEENPSQRALTQKEWLELADQSVEELRAKYGADFTVHVQELLDEVREEPTDERLGRR